MADAQPLGFGIEVSSAMVRALLASPGPGGGEAVIESFAQAAIEDMALLDVVDAIIEALPSVSGVPVVVAADPDADLSALEAVRGRLDAGGFRPGRFAVANRMGEVGQQAITARAVEVPDDLLSLYEGLESHDLAVVSGAAIEALSGSERNDAVGEALAHAGSTGFGDGALAATDQTSVADPDRSDGEPDRVRKGAAVAGAVDVDGDEEHVRADTEDLWEQESAQQERRKRNGRSLVAGGVLFILVGAVLFLTQLEGCASDSPDAEVGVAASDGPGLEATAGRSDDAEDGGGDSGADESAAVGEGEGGGVEVEEPAADPDSTTEAEAAPQPTAHEASTSTPAPTSPAASRPVAELGRAEAVVDWPTIRLVGPVASVEVAEAQFEMASDWFGVDLVIDETIVHPDAGPLEHLLLRIPASVLFEVDSERLTDTGVAALELPVRVMAEHSHEGTLLITGHAEGAGDVELADLRARVVRNYLAGRGIPASRLLAPDAGAEEPIEDENGDRIELVFLDAHGS